MTCWRFIKRWADDFSIHASLEICNLFRTLINEQHDQYNFRMIGDNALCDCLQQHCLTGPRRSYNQSALSFSDWRQQIHNAGGKIFLLVFQPDALVGIQRSQVVKKDLVASFCGMFKVNGFHFDEREIAFSIFGRPDLSRNCVPCPEIELSNLWRRNVNVIRSRQIVVIGGPEEAKTFRKYFENSFSEDQAFLFRLRFQNFKNQFLFAHAARAYDVQLLCHLAKRWDVHLL